MYVVNSPLIKIPTLDTCNSGNIDNGLKPSIVLVNSEGKKIL